MRNWHIRTTNFRVSDFLEFANSNKLELSSSFQRRPVWPKKAKSYLIDTIAQGLPVPPILLRDRTYLNPVRTLREVVDGQQRLRTVISYISPSSLSDFDEEKDKFEILSTHNSLMAGKCFNDLSSDFQQNLLQYEFNVHVLPSDVDDTDVLQIFARLNSTGVRLNYQEIRNAEYFGEFKKIAYRTSYEQLDRWRNWKVFSESEISRMNEVEMTSELLMYLVKGVQKKSQRSINKFYKDNDTVFENGRDLVSRFQKIMDKIDDSVGQDLSGTAFCRPPLFYSLFVYADCFFFWNGLRQKHNTTDKFRRHAIRASDKISSNDITGDVLDATQRRTTDKASRDAVSNFLINLK